MCVCTRVCVCVPPMQDLALLLSAVFTFGILTIAGGFSCLRPLCNLATVQPGGQGGCPLVWLPPSPF